MSADFNCGGIGIFLPVPASVFDLPTVNILFSKSIQLHSILRISIGLSPQYILNDVEQEDNLNGDIYHYDLVCKIDTENLVIYAFYELERAYDNEKNAWVYINEETDAIKNIVKENDSEVFLKCQTDKLKNELQLSIWTIQPWSSNDESIDEYLSNAMYFSNDNMCYYWNSSNIDYDDPDYFYTEFYDSTIYSIENNMITFGNGKTLSIIEIPEEDSYILAEHTGCQYRVNKNYSLPD